jgi:phosphocarrier protein HPr
MKQFQYTIKDELGVHARPAGLLVKLAKQYTSAITIDKNGKTCDMRKLMAVMGMGIRQGETITVTAEGWEGEDEAAAIEAVEKFLTENV